MAPSPDVSGWLDLWVADDGAALMVRANKDALELTITDADQAERTITARPSDDGALTCDDHALRSIEPSPDGARLFTVGVDGARTEHVRCSLRKDPHPRCLANPYLRHESNYWRLSSHDSAPKLAGADRPRNDALGVIEPRCVRCGRIAEVTQTTDDSGVGWRQQYTLLHCARCGRWSVWHYDD